MPRVLEQGGKLMRGIHWGNGKYVLSCTRIIATAECSSTNGVLWIETKSFPKDTPAGEILEWAAGIDASWRVTITPDLGTEEV